MLNANEPQIAFAMVSLLVSAMLSKHKLVLAPDPSKKSTTPCRKSKAGWSFTVTPGIKFAMKSKIIENIVSS